MARRKEARYIDFIIQDGFSGTGAINEAAPAATDTSFGVDTLSLHDAATIVPKGARFTTAGITTVRTVTATQNSQQWNLTNGGASAGTFTLTYNGDVTAGIAFDATVAAVQAAIDLLAGVIAGVTLTVTGTDAGPWTLTASGTGANISTNTLTYDGSGLTGGPGVLSVVQDGTTTWEVTFTPAIAAGSVPADDDVITWLPQRLTYKVPEDSGFSHTINNSPIIDLSRGTLDGARKGPDVPMSVSWGFIYDFLRASSGDPITAHEALYRIGDAATWHNASPDSCEPYAVDLLIVDRPPCGSEEAEMIFYRQFYPESDEADIDSAEVSISGICVAVLPEVVRVTNSDDAIGAQS